MLRLSLSSMLMMALLAGSLSAQSSPYFITYTHHMEEPGSIEVSLNPVAGFPKEGNRSLASYLELEYGARGWWSTALYLDGRSETGFTGYHFENRFRLLMQEHRVNPVL